MPVSRDVLDTIKVVVAMVCLTVLQIFNMVYLGIDSTVLLTIAIAIAGLAGYEVKTLKISMERRKERDRVKAVKEIVDREEKICYR